RAPDVHELPRRVEHEDAVIAPDAPVGSERKVPLGSVLDPRSVEVLFGELRLRDRVPDLLGRGQDEHLVDLGRLDLGHRRHRPSSWVLSSVSAETRGSEYLVIQRSWTSRIGTS